MTSKAAANTTLGDCRTLCGEVDFEMSELVGKTRSWVIEGKTIQAVFIAVDAKNDRLLFQTIDGCFRHYPMDSLCDADWKFIRRTYRIPQVKKTPKGS